MYAIRSYYGSFELFKNKTTDILVDAQFPDFVGYYPGTSQKINGGEIEKQGFDFNLNYAKTVGDFSYTIGVNCSCSEIV